MYRIKTNWLFILLMSFMVSEAQQKTKRPNVLILFLDDLDPNFGCYGNKLVTTPNIDNFAKEGMLFTKAYAAATVCSPSHTTLFTGCYASTIGAPHHRSNYIKQLPKGYTSLTELMKKAGYFTVNFKSNGGRMYNKIYGATAKTDLNFNRGKSENNLESGKEVFEHLQIIDPKNITTYFNGGEWGKKKEGQPFFAYANIETGKKHGFEPGRVWAKKNKIAVDSTKIKISPYYVDNGEVRHVLAASMDAVSHVDVEVGKFLEGLKKSGYADNTLVILASDHGATLQRHKQCIWSTGIHIPMIVRWPNRVDGNKINTDLVSIIDIAPTCLKAAGVNIPKTMEGLDLLSREIKKREYVFATRDGMNGVFDCSRTVVSREYQYIHHFYPELPFNGNYYAKKVLTFKSMYQLYKGEKLNKLQRIYFDKEKPFSSELYHLGKDSEEIKNLVGLEKYKLLEEKYRDILFCWQKKTGDKPLDVRKILGVEKVSEGTKIDEILTLKDK